MCAPNAYFSAQPLRLLQTIFLEAPMRFIVTVLLFVFAIIPQLASAGTMRCGTYTLSDAQRSGQTQAEVLYKCGQPYSKSGGTWLYVHPDGSVYRVRFGNNGELTRITREIARR